MAAADTARLIAQLELDDRRFGSGIDRASKGIDRIDRKLGAFSGAINRNVGRAVDATVARGVRAFTGAITDGLGSLAELEDATTRVDGAIAATGKTGQVTSGQIAAWANEIETNVQAAFDDKAITAATGDLLRFGKVTTDNIRPAMEVMTDLAARTGDVTGASKLLAKALADPTKAQGALRKSGVILTDAQQDQIDAMVEAGDVAGAQRKLLQELATVTGGAAAASSGKYRDTLNLMTDASEDAKKALAEGFFPVIQRVSSKITELANDPATIQRLRDFGTSLAGAFDKAVDFAESVDWKSVGSGLKVAADWAKRLFDAFMAMPPEVKGTIIALAGLNKLTGGGVSAVVSELGKGLIKGVLGMTAGVVNLKAGVVKGGGIGGGAPVPAGGKAGGLGGAAGGVAKAIGGALIVGAVAEIADAVKPMVTQAGQDIHTAIVDAFDIDIKLPIPKPSEMQWPFGPKNTPTIAPEIFGGNGLLGGTAARPQPGSGTGTNFTGGRGGPAGGRALQEAVSKGTTPTKDAVVASQGVLDKSILAGRQATLEAKREVAAKISAGTIIGANATTGAGSRVTAQSIGNTSRIVGAIAGIPAPNVAVYNDVNVSASGVTTMQTRVTRSSTTSSRTDDTYRIGGR